MKKLLLLLVTFVSFNLFAGNDGSKIFYSQKTGENSFKAEVFKNQTLPVFLFYNTKRYAVKELRRLCKETHSKKACHTKLKFEILKYERSKDCGAPTCIAGHMTMSATLRK